MRLLLISDLHCDGRKLMWVLKEAPPHEAVLIAGDMLNLFSNTAFRMQIAGAQEDRDALLAENRWLVWCSGNHDFYDGWNTAMDEASPAWMREGTSPRFVCDGETRCVGEGEDSFIVTTLPWQVSSEEISVAGKKISCLEHVKNLLKEGFSLREELSVPWILLHHSPPMETAIAGGSTQAEEALSRRIIEAAGPDFSVHGHIHEAPTQKGGSWTDRIGRTVCFNAGQSAPGKLSNAILLETQREGRWRAQWLMEGVLANEIRGVLG